MNYTSLRSYIRTGQACGCIKYKHLSGQHTGTGDPLKALFPLFLSVDCPPVSVTEGASLAIGMRAVYRFLGTFDRGRRGSGAVPYHQCDVVNVDGYTASIADSSDGSSRDDVSMIMTAGNNKDSRFYLTRIPSSGRQIWTCNTV